MAEPRFKPWTLRAESQLLRAPKGIPCSLLPHERALQGSEVHLGPHPSLLPQDLRCQQHTSLSGGLSTAWGHWDPPQSSSEDPPRLSSLPTPSLLQHLQQAPWASLGAELAPLSPWKNAAKSGRGRVSHPWDPSCIACYLWDSSACSGWAHRWHVCFLPRRASHCLMSCSSSGSHPVQVTCCFERRYGRRLSRGRKKRDPHSPGSALLPLGKERQLAPILCAPSTQVQVVPKRCYHSQSCVITSQASCSTRTSLQPPDPAMCPMDVAK